MSSAQALKLPIVISVKGPSRQNAAGVDLDRAEALSVEPFRGS